MSAVSPGSRLAAPQSSEVYQKHIEDKGTRDSVALLLSIVKSCYGHRGQLKMVQNACGGHVTVTSASSRLFPVLSISKPVLKLIVSAVQTHLREFNDGGLFSSLLSLFIIQKSLNQDDGNRILMCDILDYFKKFCMGYLNAPNCCLKFGLDFSNIDMMLTLLRSVMGTKCGCSLNDNELDHVSQLVLETFLKTFRENAVGNNFSHVDILAVNGSSPSLSCLKRGVLFEKRHSEKLVQNVQIKTIQNGNSEVIRCCLVDISLSGDSDEFVNFTFEMDACDTIESGIVKTILLLCKKLVADGVGVIFCQKVIHPAIQEYLRGNGVLAIDRLGLASTRALLELTGCVPISSLVATPCANNYANIDSLGHVEINKKHYYHIQSAQSLVSTVVLYGRNEEALSELQHVFKVGLDTLQMAVCRKEMVPGGGCFETCLAKIVKKQVLDNIDKLMTKFACSKSSLQAATNTFLHCLESVAVSLDPNCQHFTDAVTGHHWSAEFNSSLGVDYSKTFRKCCCGMVENDTNIDFRFRELFPVSSQTLLENVSEHLMPVPDLKTMNACVIDPLLVKLHAFHVALSTAGMVLRVGTFISDTN